MCLMWPGVAPPGGGPTRSDDAAGGRDESESGNEDLLRQIDEDDIRFVTQPIEHDLLAIRRDVERADHAVIAETCQRTR